MIALEMSVVSKSIRIHLARIVVLSIASLVLSVTSCNAWASTSRCERQAARKHRFLPVGKLANWEPVDNADVLIWTRDSARAYLVRLARPLAGLTAASIITVVAGADERFVTACGRDALMLQDGYGGDRERITSILRLSERQTTRLERASVSESPMTAI